MDGKLYKRLRMALGFTTSELGEKVGVGSNYISIMENGKKPVSELQAMKLKELIEQRYKEGDECFEILKEIFCK